MNNIINPITIYENETWTPITELVVPNIQPWYSISTFGRIYSSKSNKMLSQVIDKYGYCVVCLYRKDGSHISKFVHRLVLLSFNYILDNELFQVNHGDGIKTNNYLYNLRWCTPQENVIHAYNTGLNCGSSGENNPQATISNEQAEEICRLLLLQIYKHKEIANMIGCSVNIVNSIANGDTWKDIYNKYNLSIKRESRIFTNEQLHHICKYFEDHINDNLNRTDLFKNSLKGLNIEYCDSLRKTMSRILKKERFHNITLLYNY